jgi:hypothetical protein
MFSKKESKQLREQFWTSFGKSFPKKWMLYRTGLSGVVLKFHFDLEKALVSLEIERGTGKREKSLWEKLVALKSVLRSAYLPEAIYEVDHLLENHKTVSRIYVQKKGVCIHNKDTWMEVMLFLKDHMSLMESFFVEYRDYLDT